MRIAFYAPLKPPDHPVASGDRAMARALIAALQRAGHDVSLASHFRSYDSGDPKRQARLREQGHKIAHRLLRRIGKGEPAPDLWFTYHLYHKAPDWIGPTVARRLGIPYVVAEASFAPKQAGGKFDLGHRAVAEALGQAALVLQPNPADAECVLPILASQERLVALPPFLDTSPFKATDRSASRHELAGQLDLDPSAPWLLTVAMMRDDQKLLSYRTLADALSRLGGRPWRLIIVGGGPAEEFVRSAFATVADHVRWAGIVAPEDLRRFYRASDLYVWPAIKEAYGMTMLEAQAAGLPVVAGRSGGVAGVVADTETGLLVPEGDTEALAAAIHSLLSDPDRRRKMGEAASLRAARVHDIEAAASLLDARLRPLVPPA